MSYLLIIKTNKCYESHNLVNLHIIPNDDYNFQKYCYKSIDEFPFPNTILYSCLLEKNSPIIPNQHKTDNPYFFHPSVIDYLQTRSFTINTDEIAQKYKDFYPLYRADKESEDENLSAYLEVYR